MKNLTARPAKTDWHRYYQVNPFLSRFTRPIIEKAFLTEFKRYSPPGQRIAELGGAGSRVLGGVLREMQPTEFHIIDNNAFGLDLLKARSENGLPMLRLHNADVATLSLPLRLDVVYSLGLIEHFDEEGTRRAVASHFDLLKPGGIAIISFPTPTLLYRSIRRLSEMAGKWIFHDERPLKLDEVRAAAASYAELLRERIIWPIGLTQALVVFRKHIG